MKTKNFKFIATLAVAALSVCTLPALAACKEKNDGLHGADGHLHVAESYRFDETNHWKVCEICGENFAMTAHSCNEGVCQCGYYTLGTEGLEYSEIKNESGEVISYSVTGIGTATDTRLYIPYYHNSLPVTEIAESAFKDCSQLVSLTLPDSVTDMGFYAFQGCTELESVYTGKGLKAISFCIFDGCSKLSEVVMGASVTSLGEWAFRNCTSLEEIYLPENVDDLNGGAFDGCTNLKYNEYDNAIYLGSETNPYIALMNVQNKNITQITIADGARFINGNSFLNCSKLTELELPEGVLSIARSTFSGCTHLETVSLPSTLKSIGNTSFQNCKALKEVVIPENVTSIGQNAFQNCTSLTSAVFKRTDGWYYKTMLNVEKTTDVTDDLSDTSTAAKCLVTTYSQYFLMHD